MLRLGPILALIGLLFWTQAEPAYASAEGEKKAAAKEGGGKSEGEPSGGKGGGGVVHDGSEGSRVDGTYITIAPIIITVFRKNGAVGKLSAVFTLELVDEAAVAVAAVQHAKLRDALIRELHRLSEREARLGREYSVGQIKRRVKVIVAKQLGEKVVLDVLVQALTRG
ncbi:MAG: flagellar basal body-associated FliL family protein [Alphaproteobacteria bacterium]